jgi:glycosyltransferase involved in cell wall biosynthesis
MTPRVSVVIPTFNCGRYIGDALRSIETQQLTDCEVIVVDDCSTDETHRVVNALYPAAIYLRNDTNQGVSVARNRALAQARGTYVAFLDADDAWLPGKLQSQIDVLERESSVVAIGGEMIPFMQAIPQSGNAVPSVIMLGFRDMVIKNHLATPTVVVRREALARVGEFSERLKICEDYDLWLRLAEIGVIAKLCVPLARYRRRADGLSAGDGKITYALHCEFVRGLPRRFSHVQGIDRLVRMHLAQMALERAIEHVDVNGECLAGCAALAESWCQWPLALPTSTTHFLRLRRLAHTVRKGLANLCGLHMHLLDTAGIEK